MVLLDPYSVDILGNPNFGEGAVQFINWPTPGGIVFSFVSAAPNGAITEIQTLIAPHYYPDDFILLADYSVETNQLKGVGYANPLLSKFSYSLSKFNYENHTCLYCFAFTLVSCGGLTASPPTNDDKAVSTAKQEKDPNVWRHEVGPYPFDLEVADVNSDGLKDLVIMSHGEELLIYKNTESGSSN